MSAGEAVTVEQSERVVEIGEARVRTRRRRRTVTPVAAPVAAPVEATVAVSQPGAKNSALKEAPKPGDGVDPNHPQRAEGLVIADHAAGRVVGGTRKRIAVCGFA